MTAVPPLPPAPPTPAAPAAAATAAEVVTLAAPPSPELAAKLAALKQLQALVRAIDVAAGAVTLTTEAGTLAVKLQIPVQPGSRLVLQVGDAGPAAVPPLRLIAVDGRPPLQAARVAALAAAAGPRPEPAATLPPLPAPAAAAPAVIATVIRALPGPGLAQGASFAVKVLAVAPPALVAEAPIAPPLSAPAAPTQPAGAALPSPAASPPHTPAAASAAQMPIQPVQSLPPAASVGTAAPSPMPPPGAAPAQASPPAALPQAAQPVAPGPAAAADLPARIAATVAPNSHAGQPLLRTEIGMLSLAGTPPLPPGAQVLLEVVGRPQAPQVPAPTAPVLPASGTGLSGLAETLEVLRQLDPAAAQRLQAALPQIGPRLAAGMMTLAAAVQTDAIKALVAEGAVPSLDRAGRRETARRLAADLAEMAPQTRQGPSGEWRVLTMPLMHGAVVEPVRLWLRRPEWEDEDGEDGRRRRGAGSGDRFVVDLTLARIGRFQLDSLIRRAAKRFDMVIRSETPLPEPMRRDIGDIFRRCCDGLGMAGNLLFQGRPFLDPEGEAGPRQPSVLV